jgi:FlaG/FlaF family flagellin (archaellin)
MRKITDKKGLSEMVGYVLLIVIAISLSALVYTWLKNYIPVKQEKCPDSANLIVEDYSCQGSVINVSLRNMGTFNIDGLIIRAGNKTKAIYPLKATGETMRLESSQGSIYFLDSMKPNDLETFTFSYLDINSIKVIEIEPIRIQGNKTVVCEDAVVSTNIENC